MKLIQQLKDFFTFVTTPNCEYEANERDIQLVHGLKRVPGINPMWPSWHASVQFKGCTKNVDVLCCNQCVNKIQNDQKMRERIENLCSVMIKKDLSIFVEESETGLGVVVLEASRRYYLMARKDNGEFVCFDFRKFKSEKEKLIVDFENINPVDYKEMKTIDRFHTLSHTNFVMKVGLSEIIDNEFRKINGILNLSKQFQRVYFEDIRN